jgi:hypothetical protein
MISSTWQIVDMIVARLEAQSGPLGLKYVGAYDEKLIPKYPAVVVLPGPRAKQLHGTHTFQTAFQVELYIYHANLTLNKRERSKADLQLVERIETELDSDFRWIDEDGGASLIHGYVTNENPGILQPRVGKTGSVICTRLTWNAISQRRF